VSQQLDALTPKAQGCFERVETTTKELWGIEKRLVQCEDLVATALAKASAKVAAPPPPPKPVMEPLVMPEGSTSDEAATALQNRLSELSSYVEQLHATMWTRVDSVEEAAEKAAKRVSGVESAIGVRGSVELGGVQALSQESTSAVVRELAKALQQVKGELEEVKAREPTVVQQVIQPESPPVSASGELAPLLLAEVTKIKIMMDAKMAQYEGRFYDDTEVRRLIATGEDRSAEQYRHTEELIQGLSQGKLDKGVMERIEATVQLAEESYRQCNDLEYKLAGRLTAVTGHAESAKEFMEATRKKLPLYALKSEVRKLYDHFGAPSGATTYTKTICLACDKQLGESQPTVMPSSPVPLHSTKPEMLFSGANKPRPNGAKIPGTSPRPTRPLDRPRTTPGRPIPVASPSFSTANELSPTPWETERSPICAPVSVNGDDDMTLIDESAFLSEELAGGNASLAGAVVNLPDGSNRSSAPPPQPWGGRTPNSNRAYTPGASSTVNHNGFQVRGSSSTRKYKVPRSIADEDALRSNTVAMEKLALQALQDMGPGGPARPNHGPPAPRVI